MTTRQDEFRAELLDLLRPREGASKTGQDTMIYALNQIRAAATESASYAAARDAAATESAAYAAERHHDDNVEYSRVLAQRDALLEAAKEAELMLQAMLNHIMQYLPQYSKMPALDKLRDAIKAVEEKE